MTSDQQMINKNGKMRRNKSRRKSGEETSSQPSTADGMFYKYYSNHLDKHRDENEPTYGPNSDELDTDRKYQLFTFDDAQIN